MKSTKQDLSSKKDSRVPDNLIHAGEFFSQGEASIQTGIRRYHLTEAEIMYSNAPQETFEKCSILLKIKAREDFKRRNIFNISRIEIGTQHRD